MEFGRRFDKLFSKDPIKKLDPLPHMQEPADPRISSRILNPEEGLKRGEENDYGNPTLKDAHGGTLHEIVTTSILHDRNNAAGGGDDFYKYPYKQQIVTRLLKGFANVSDVVFLPGKPYTPYSYEPAKDTIPRGADYEERMYADRFLLAHLFGSHEHYSRLRPDPTRPIERDTPKNMSLAEGKDHMIFDFEYAQLTGDPLDGQRNFDREPIIEVPQDAKTLAVLKAKLEAMQKRYEGEEGIAQVKAIFADYDPKDTWRFGNEETTVEGFWAEFTTRIGTLLEKVREQEKKIGEQR